MSSRRSNDGSPLEVEGSTAGATSHRDLGTWANLGELSAWLKEDEVALMRFVTWYNATAARLKVQKRIVGEDVFGMAAEMFDRANAVIRQVRGG